MTIPKPTNTQESIMKGCIASNQYFPVKIEICENVMREPLRFKNVGIVWWIRGSERQVG
jgi:hypothetical protein